MESSSKTNLKAQQIISSADRTMYTLTREQLIQFITTFCNITLSEITNTNKKVSELLSELVGETFSRIENNNGLIFHDDHEALKYIYNETHCFIWYIAIKEEANYIIQRLTSNDIIFAKHFFYDDNPKGCNISRLRSKILSQIWLIYHIKLSKQEFNTVIYTLIWADGTWSALKSYRYESSIFAWMLNVAKNGIILYLKQMGMIKEAPKRTIANTRTKLLSKNALTCEFVIEMVVQNADMRKILIDIYVKRIDDSTIMSRLGMNEEQYNKIKDKAIAILKSGIIRSPYNFEDMLGDKEHKVVTVTTEYATQFAEWCEYKAEENPLIDIFGTNLSDEEIAEKVDELLHSMYEKMDWNESERYLWRKRYFEDASPNDLAEELGIRRSNVDVRYSRLKAKFYSALREWWKENSK